MSKSFQNARVLSLVFGATALIALVGPVAPAAAQGVPAGLLRLDSVQPFNDQVRQTYAQETNFQDSNVRAAHGHGRKHHVDAR
jgi:hypothetical protein